VFVAVFREFSFRKKWQVFGKSRKVFCCQYDKVMENETAANGRGQQK